MKRERIVFSWQLATRKRIIFGFFYWPFRLTWAISSLSLRDLEVLGPEPGADRKES